VYGAQSSGATLVALLLAQERGSVACLDVYCGAPAPPAAAYPAERATVVKATVSTVWTFADHVARVEPDRSLLVLRHPVHVYASLVRKPYAAMGGAPDAKLRRLEAEARERERFDVVIRYEDVVFDTDRVCRSLRSTGVPLPPDAAALPRTRQEVTAAARAVSGLGAEFQRVWGTGNLHPRGIDRAQAFERVPAWMHAHVATLCPRLTAEFDAWYETRYPTWRVIAGGWWGDALEPRVRGWARRSRERARRAVRSDRD
jgi:hypothetical protein